MINSTVMEKTGNLFQTRPMQRRARMMGGE